MSWRRSAKAQPADTKFVVPATDAPNVLGARDLGLAVGAGLDGAPDLSALRSAVEAGHVGVLYVLDPGPAESIGDLGWVIEARQAGRVKALIYQGVLAGPLASAADIVLPGRRLGREGRLLHQRSGPRPGGVEGTGHARRGRGGLADPHQRGRGARTALRL